MIQEEIEIETTYAKQPLSITASTSHHGQKTKRTLSYDAINAFIGQDIALTIENDMHKGVLNIMIFHKDTDEPILINYFTGEVSIPNSWPATVPGHHAAERVGD